MKKIILSLLIIFCVAFYGQVVLAVGPTLSVQPASAVKNVGASFNTEIKIDPAGNKICVVKGTLIFNNLSCQSISVTSGLMAQVAPTCSNPNFTIGIPTCSSDIKNIISVLAKGNTVGQGSISFASVKAINIAGNNAVDVPLTLQNGSYTIETISVPVVEKAEEDNKDIKKIVQETEELPVEEQQLIAENVIPKTAGVAGLSTIFSNPFGSPILIIFIIIILTLIGLWAFDKFYLSKKRIK